jgi:hypothetical protein
MFDLIRQYLIDIVPIVDLVADRIVEGKDAAEFEKSFIVVSVFDVEEKHEPLTRGGLYDVKQLFVDVFRVGDNDDARFNEAKLAFYRAFTRREVGRFYSEILAVPIIELEPGVFSGNRFIVWLYDLR